MDRKWLAMTSWLEPLGRDRARRARARAGIHGPSSRDWLAGMMPADGRGPATGPERRPGMAGRVAAPGTVLEGGTSELAPPARSLEPAGGLWPVGGPRRAQWSPVGPGLARLRRPPGFRAIFAAMNASIVRLDAPLEPDVSTPDADRLLVGVPEHRVWNYFTDSTQTFFAGRWAGTRGKWRVRYTENELCVMTAGRVVITSESGNRSEFGPGAAFVIPAGFVGTWEVLEDCAKVYAIFEPRA
jgi:uncharacterized protein